MLLLLIVSLCSLIPFTLQSSSSCAADYRASNVEDDPDAVSIQARVYYEVGLLLNEVTLGEDGWWNRIEPYAFYLGALPLKNKGHLERLISLNITGVVSITKKFELEEGWTHTPVSPQDWSDHRIVTDRIDAEDGVPLSVSQLAKAVSAFTKMMSLLRNNERVYLHCKSGVGRSATVAVAYIMQKDRLPFDRAYAIVSRQRAIKIDSVRQNVILSYILLQGQKQK